MAFIPSSRFPRRPDPPSYGIVNRDTVPHTLPKGKSRNGVRTGGSTVTRLYAAGNEAVAVIDEGRSTFTFEQRGARCVAADPKDPNTLYVGTTDEGLFKSEDGGGSWDELAGIEHPR